MKIAAESFGCNVTAVVTDNERKMNSMHENLKEDNPSLTVYGCLSHWLNLLGQDVTPSQAISQIVEVNKYFRNHHVPGTLLSEATGSVKPQLPSDTCWNSQLTCVMNHVTFYSLIYIRRKPQYCGRIFSDLLLVSYAYLVFFFVQMK
ncbi:hypothetical protein LSH36_16g07014 [Paralvinella palmiformis]|uniref:Uncharacterized protein n=1 Tax=Paralvinella palmiformis TaxID=53620 RepID=A0AAD9KD54_9ANNE|nr:hypothetical protein LSH36_16g07014 [Paralvinella palmiformis]